LKLVHKGILLLFVPLACELGFGWAMFQLNNQAEASAMRQTRAAEIRSLTDQIWAVNVSVAWELLGLQSGGGSREKIAQIAKEMDPLLAELRRKGNVTNSSDNVHAYEVMVSDLLRRERVLSNSVDEDGLEIPFYNLAVMKGEWKAKLKNLAAIKKLIEDEANKESFEQSIKAGEARKGQQVWLGAFVLVNIAFCILAAFFLYKNIASRYSIILENSRRFGRRDQLLEKIGGDDEITDLDKTFHEMWNAVEEASRRERAMIDNAVDVICSINEFGTFTAVSPAAQRMWGYEPDQLIGKNIADLIIKPHQESAFSALTTARKSGENALFENQIVTKSGGARDMQWSTQWSTKDLTFFCVVHDISDRKSIERLKQDFVNMISHDLKTPLTAVRLTLELVLQGVYGELDAKGQNRITVAQDSTQRLLELVNQLLQLERLEAGKMELDKAPQAVLPLLTSACDSVQTLAEQHDVRTAVSCPEELTAEIDGDRIIQVVINLVSNAIKFSPPQSTIVVSAKPDEDRLYVAVRDEGRGVPEHLQLTIFNRFEQVERADSVQKGGTGLGLAICQAIVKAHDGMIGVNSTEGQGSEFWFKIPLGLATAPPVEERVNVTG